MVQWAPWGPAWLWPVEDELWWACQFGAGVLFLFAVLLGGFAILQGLLAVGHLIAALLGRHRGTAAERAPLLPTAHPTVCAAAAGSSGGVAPATA